MEDYLTTKELAALLRIKERKVYDLAASGKVPYSKVTGKLLFARDQIEDWIARNQTGAAWLPPQQPPPNVVLGSHDPLLEWALRESRSGLATFFDGSVDGLERFAGREGLGAAIHIYDPEARDWNTPRLLGEAANRPVVAVEWARRQRGIVTTAKLARRVSGLGDLSGLRIAGRQAEAGAQVLFETLLEQQIPTGRELDVSVRARSELDVVVAVVEGAADACFGLKFLAEQHRLAFVPVIEERFDLLVDRRAWFEPPMQTLMAFCRSEVFARRAANSPGYDFSDFATVRFNGP